MDRGLRCADEGREGLALAACRECRVEQRRGVGAAADVRVADGRRLAVRAGEGDLPGGERPVRVRDPRLRLIAGEPAKVRAADTDAGQHPAVVLLAPCVQGAGADADGEQQAQDERDTEAEGERPPAPGPGRGRIGGRGGQDRHGIDGLGGIRVGLGRGIVVGGVRVGRLGCLVGGGRHSHRLLRASCGLGGGGWRGHGPSHEAHEGGQR